MRSFLDPSQSAMLAAVTAALAFSAPPSAFTTRREAMALLGAGAAFGCAPLAARAEYMGAPPPKASGAAYKEALEDAKAYKYAKRPDADDVSTEFKQAAAKREAAEAARAAGKKVDKTESVSDDLARLGLKPFSG